MAFVAGAPATVAHAPQPAHDERVVLCLADVEQVFCTSEAGGQITYANLTRANPRFVNVTDKRVTKLNGTVARIIR